MLKPFWRYYGGKWRAAPRYPAPMYPHIIEPFAGAAGYAMRYPDRQVTLVEKYPVVAGIWRYLIAVSPDEVLRIPLVEAVSDLPAWVPQEARWLVGFTMNAAVTAPRNVLSAGRQRLAGMGRKFEGWTGAQRERVASQVDAIRHWRVVEGAYTDAPDVEATWFVDPPYENAGKHYVHGSADLEYRTLGDWCRTRRGQTMVCENVGATWLPFVPFMAAKAGPAKQVSHEALWVNDRT